MYFILFFLRGDGGSVRGCPSFKNEKSVDVAKKKKKTFCNVHVLPLEGGAEPLIPHN